MRTHRFYHAHPMQVGQEQTLASETLKHIKALRITENEDIILFNGSGIDYQASVARIDRKHVLVQITQSRPNATESPLVLHLGQGLARGEKMDFIIQKATELGVSEITPLFTEFCNVKLSGERIDKKVEHWQKVAISASEQSGRAIVPKVHPPTHLAIWLETLNGPQGFVLNPTGETTCKQLTSPPQEAALLIGPEGGLSGQEITQAQQKRFIDLTLGPRVLRTETAGLAAISALQTLWGDF